MKLLSIGNTSMQRPSAQLARLSGPHGYRLDGDTVQLNARFTEAKSIRARWGKLKSMTEGFVRGCEEGNFRPTKTGPGENENRASRLDPNG